MENIYDMDILRKFQFQSTGNHLGMMDWDGSDSNLHGRRENINL